MVVLDGDRQNSTSAFYSMICSENYHPKADEIGERITDAFMTLRAERGTDGNVTLLDVYQHDVLNHTLTGTIKIDDQLYGFICEIGNWVGFAMKEWGDHEDIGYYNPPVIEPTILLPDWISWPEESYGFRVQVYARLLLRPDIVKKLAEYAYDRHFQPGGCIEGCYREWATKMGGTLGCFSSLPLRIQQDVKQWHRMLNENKSN